MTIGVESLRMIFGDSEQVVGVWLAFPQGLKPASFWGRLRHD
jgi:hypothetical protein